MTTIRTDYLENFERRVEQELLRLCTSAGMLNGTLLASDDIDEHWHKLAPEYMADAVPQVKDYPTVSVAWASYLGIAIAWGWDTDWALCKEDPYTSYYGKQGFDDMDEHIVYDMLGLTPDGYEARDIESIIRRGNIDFLFCCCGCIFIRFSFFSDFCGNRGCRHLCRSATEYRIKCLVHRHCIII